MVFAYADDIKVFVSCLSDIEAVKKTIVWYEQIVGTKMKFDKSESMRLGAWRCGFPLPGTFCRSDRPIRFQLEWNWSEVLAKQKHKWVPAFEGSCP